ncbi:acetylxylan esterase [Amycolatopsis cihanbeyliensis]|uniref:poly(ethylene terephthalate) hydrolase family protein n=1 Tax=Amycolatopsis cihanbeyliensis TaxID=1128664 RepID=UPI001FE7BFAB|nr:acetylxylan esterase [Amycolatopsis cihanbeyliensis]
MVAVAMVLVVPPAQGVGAADSAVVSVAEHWADPGPSEVVVEVGLAHTFYRPAGLAEQGGKHPVIVWGNGTGATPVAYDGLLRHWASYGFIVAAANTPFANSGQAMLDGARWLVRENDRPGSLYYQKVDTGAIGSAGHSQGGAGAINAGTDPVITTTIALQPGPLADSSALHGPTLFLAGQDDKIVKPGTIVLPFYEAAIQVPAVYAELAGAGHFEPAGNGGRFRGVLTAWFAYRLMGDEQAKVEFTGPSCGLCTDPEWSDVRRNDKTDNVLPGLPVS